ncbi:V-type proton ATPase subunit F [Geodia barretti]|uniref:V-type proton ATPase subunit F n=1 Tax=Geodia barretti TaxID=519541 RepID=A0AA35XDQ3_GEOBA|nr:V-type proton ATPase subunit F [Geodia barretti]
MADFKGGKLLAVIGDEDTCTGFLLGGVGEMDAKRQPNFLVVRKETAVSDIEESFKAFLTRTDIAIILINQNIAEMIRHLVDAHDKPTPAILEIPSKDHPYDPSKDGILRRARVSKKFFYLQQTPPQFISQMSSYELSSHRECSTQKISVRHQVEVTRRHSVSRVFLEKKH